MKALLLAAGLGTRLRPLTNTIPKCMVSLNNKPLLQHWIENLMNVGINEFVINTHYFHEQVEAFIEKLPYKNQIHLVYEKELLNTGGTLLANKAYLEDKAFMLVHADNVSVCDYSAFIQAHASRPLGAEITMMLFKTDTPKSCGIVKLDDNGVVQEFHEKVQNPPSNLANGAVYICEPSVFEFLESLHKKEIDFSLDVLPHYMGRINTFLNDVYHRDIGTIKSYEKACEDFKTNPALK